jgi:hypothetical protein
LLILLLCISLFRQIKFPNSVPKETFSGEESKAVSQIKLFEGDLLLFLSRSGA